MTTNGFVIGQRSSEVMHVLHPRLRYPNLWRGCVGAWAPCLGPGGLILQDNSGRGSATLTNMELSDWVKEEGQYSLDYDGSNEYTLIGNVPQLTFERTDSFSCAARIYLDTTAPVASTILGKSNAGGGTPGWVFHCFRRASLNSTAIGVQLINGSSNLIELNSGAATIAAGQLYHVAFTYAGTSTAAGVRLYINGVPQTATVVTDTLSATIVGTNGALIGGRHSTAPTQFLNGRIGEVQVWNRALAESEVRLHSRRQGIAYEIAPRRSYMAAVAGGITGPLISGKLSRQASLTGGRLVQ